MCSLFSDAVSNSDYIILDECNAVYLKVDTIYVRRSVC
jgi:hypothetical protein